MQGDEEVAGFAAKFSSKWQYLLDNASPHITIRWIVFVGSLLLYFFRLYLANGWFIVTYGLGIFLSQSIGFLSPQVTVTYQMCYMQERHSILLS